jgi:hypothetical protein
MIGKQSGPVIQQLFHRMLSELVRENGDGVATRMHADSVAMESGIHCIADELFVCVVIWRVDPGGHPKSFICGRRHFLHPTGV